MFLFLSHSLVIYVSPLSFICAFIACSLVPFHIHYIATLTTGAYRLLKPFLSSYCMSQMCISVSSPALLQTQISVILGGNYRNFHFFFPPPVICPLLPAAAVAPTCKCQPGAGRRVRAHQLQGVRRLLHAVERQRLARLDRLRCFIPGLSEGDALGCVWLRRQRNDPPALLFLRH